MEDLVSKHSHLLTGRWITDLANTSALIFTEIQGINWVGFYLAEGKKLFLGPFQGKPACTSIEWGRGVCGTAASTQKIQIIDDVHKFEGHITCDPDSKSELVIPMIVKNQVIGVLDLDSPLLARFSQMDADKFAAIVDQLLIKSYSGRT